MNVAIPWSREVALGLSKLGHEIHVIDFAEWSASGGHFRAEDAPQRVEIQRLRDAVASMNFMNCGLRSKIRYLVSAWTLKHILQRCQADALLVLYGGGFAATAYASGFRPYFVYAVGSDILLTKGLSRLFGRVALTSAALVCVNGNYLTQRARLLAPNARVVPLYIGIDTEIFSPIPRPDAPVHIVCTRGFSEVYNNEYLIRALAAMPELLTKSQVTFVSAGPLLERTRRLAQELLPPGIRDKLRFLGGVSRACVVESLRKSHIYVSTSRSDGTSSSLLEALACGLFPVLSDIPQNREWVSEDAQNGILVPLDHPEIFAKALYRAICDATWRQRVADYNRNLVVTKANSARNISLLASALRFPGRVPYLISA